MANNQSTTNSSKKRKLVIAIVLALLLASLFSFKSPSKNESIENEQEITNIVPNDEAPEEGNVVQENNDNSNQANNNENSSLNSSIDNSSLNSSIDNSNTQNNSGNNDNSLSGSQDSDDQIGSVPTPEQPNIPEDDDQNQSSILKLLYDELIKANNTFQYLLELTNEILENY